MPPSRKRAANQLRPLKLTPNWLHNAEGSCLIEAGQTRVVAAASFTTGVPGFLRGQGLGWVTAEYGMLPRSTNERMQREAAKGKQGGRTVEIQRLIGRALRQAVDMKTLGENTIVIDCDVLDADGGTRTAAISAGYVALALAVRHAIESGRLKSSPLVQQVAAVSVGIVDGKPMLDLDYELDCRADVDMNVVMTSKGKFIEVQGTGEHAAFSEVELRRLIALARGGLEKIFDGQRRAIAEKGAK